MGDQPFGTPLDSLVCGVTVGLDDTGSYVDGLTLRFCGQPSYAAVTVGRVSAGSSGAFDTTADDPIVMVTGRSEPYVNQVGAGLEADEGRGLCGGWSRAKEGEMAWSMLGSGGVGG